MVALPPTMTTSVRNLKSSGNRVVVLLLRICSSRRRSLLHLKIQVCASPLSARSANNGQCAGSYARIRTTGPNDDTIGPGCRIREASGSRTRGREEDLCGADGGRRSRDFYSVRGIDGHSRRCHLDLDGHIRKCRHDDATEKQPHSDQSVSQTTPPSR